MEQSSTSPHVIMVGLHTPNHPARLGVHSGGYSINSLSYPSVLLRDRLTRSHYQGSNQPSWDLYLTGYLTYKNLSLQSPQKSVIESVKTKPTMADWQAKAAEKRQSLINLIPPEWVIPPPPTSDATRDITGDYIRQYLNENEIGITESDVSAILSHIHEGRWKARDVAEAFCHRAAVAHQLVS